MSIDGFVTFLGLVVAIFALLSVVGKYRLRLYGLWLVLPTFVALAAVIYFLLFDLLAPICDHPWCHRFELPLEKGLTPNKVAFILVLAWLGYSAALSLRKRVGKRQLPLVASFVDRLIGEKRYSELVDFLEPQVPLIAKYVSRQFPLQRMRDQYQRFKVPKMPEPEPPAPTRLGLIRHLKDGMFGRYRAGIQKLLERFPESKRKSDAAKRILRLLHTNDAVIEYLALERPLFALRLMRTNTYDYEFSDLAFELMMSHPQSQLRRETLLNQNTGLCFFHIDPQNPLIHELFSDSKVAEKLEVYRPIGNYPLRLLERNTDNYRQTISASKPVEDRLIHRDPTYCMIRFFDIMVRSAMRDGIEWHMWLFYFDILVDKLLKSMDRSHPDYVPDAEFPNFGYYLIFEVFSTYGDWLRAVECCAEDSPVTRIQNTTPDHENGSIFKSAMLSVGNSLRRLLENDDTHDDVITYLLGMVMRDYRDLAKRKNAGARAQETLRNSILNGGYSELKDVHIARLGDCYAGIDPLLQFETKDFADALAVALNDDR